MKLNLFVVILLVILGSNVSAQLKENSQKVKEDLNSAEVLAKGSLPQVSPFAIDLNNAGVTLTLAQRHDEALANFRQAVALAPSSSVIKRNLAMSMLKAKHYDEAANFCQKLISENSTAVDSRFYIILGGALYESGNFAESVTAYRKAVEADKENAELLNDYGIAIFHTNNYEESRKVFQEALRIKPDFADALNNYGVVLMRLGQHREAINQFKKSIQFQPTFVLSHNNLGIAYNYLGERKKALECYEEALRLKPEWGQPHYNLAVLYLNQGDRQKAWEHLNALRKLDTAMAVNLQERFSRPYVVNAAEIK